MKDLRKTDPEIAELIRKEGKRQVETLMMIPSENYISKAVAEAVGSCLSNKYAEGYPFKKYYQGQKYIDQIEDLVIERAKEFFGVPYVNVQPLSGAPANLAVYHALLKPGDKIMALDLAHGGHLTHGAPASVSGTLYQQVPYFLNNDGKLDYILIEQLALKERPKLIVAGFSAYPLQVDWEKFSSIAKKINAFLLADVSHVAGLIVGGAYPSPVPFAEVITTTTHKTLRGPRGALIMVTEKGLKKDSGLPLKIDKAVFPGLQGGPHMNNIAGIGVALKEAKSDSFKKYAFEIVKNSMELAVNLAKNGFCLSGGGSNSHLILIDLRKESLTGNLVAEALEKVGIVVNKNLIPFDPGSAFYPSGIRLGTPAVTSRGMGKTEMKIIAKWMTDIIGEAVDIKKKRGLDLASEKDKKVREEIVDSLPSVKSTSVAVKNLCLKFPVKTFY